MEGTDTGALWDEFEFFEALHHHLDIMNPLRGEHLDWIVDAVLAAGGPSVRTLDIGCGHGEFLIRVAAAAREIDVRFAGVGVDISPWQVDRACRRTEIGGVGDSIEFWLGDGAAVPGGRRWDISAALGVSWIWRGFEGTIAALDRHTRSGGVLVLGDVQLRDVRFRSQAEADYGMVLTDAEQRAVLENGHFEILAEVPTAVADFLRYDGDTAEGLRRWVADHPDGARFIDRHQEWTDAHRSDAAWLGWKVWVVRTPT